MNTKSLVKAHRLLSDKIFKELNEDIKKICIATQCEFIAGMGTFKENNWV